MREILFRGKRKDSGEWVEGRLLAADVIVPSGQEFILEANCIYGCDKPIIAYDVDKETVGQFTGLTDKNGNKIFEGDIVISPNGTMGYVEWQNGECAYLVNILDDLQTMDDCEYEVIGNIYDNPELFGAQV